MRRSRRTKDPYSKDFKNTQANTGIGKFLSDQGTPADPDIAQRASEDMAEEVAASDNVVSKAAELTRAAGQDPKIKDKEPPPKPKDYNGVKVLSEGGYDPHGVKDGTVDVSHIKDKFDKKDQNTINNKPEVYFDKKLDSMKSRTAFNDAKRTLMARHPTARRPDEKPTQQEDLKPSYTPEPDVLDNLLKKTTGEGSFFNLWRMKTGGFRLEIAGLVYIDFSHKKFALEKMKELDDVPHKVVIHHEGDVKIIYDYGTDSIRVKIKDFEGLFLFNEVKKDKFLCATFEGWSEKSKDNQIVYEIKGSIECTCGESKCPHVIAYKVWKIAKFPLTKADRIISDNLRGLQPNLSEGHPVQIEKLPKK